VPFMQVPMPWSTELCVALTRALWRMEALFHLNSHVDAVKASNAGPPNHVLVIRQPATFCIVSQFSTLPMPLDDGNVCVRQSVIEWLVALVMYGFESCVLITHDFMCHP